MSELRNPHDRFFQEVFGQPDAARDFVTHYLPPKVVGQLRLETLEPAKGSFIDPELRAHLSDLLFRVELASGGSSYLYLLFEHKSHPDPDTPFQLLRYLVRLWETHRRTHPTGPLPPVLPVVFYHGARRWRVARSFRERVKCPEEFIPYLPDFAYELCDLTTYTDQEIRGQVVLRAALLALKYAVRPDLIDHLPYIFGLFRELSQKNTGLEALETLLRYLVCASDAVDSESLHRLLEENLPGKGDHLMPTIADQWVQQGLDRGVDLGVHKGEAAVLVRLATRKYGSLTEAHRGRIDASDAETLLRWSERILWAQSVDEVFED